MIAQLEQFRQHPDPATMSFLNEPLIEHLQRSLPLATNWQKRVIIQLELATQLLQAGRTEVALTEFQAVEDGLAKVGGRFDEVGRNKLRMGKAVAMLRLGEQENCLLNHNAESCLIPLRPAAFHQLPRGSQGAIVLFTDQLKEYPQDLTARWLINLAYMTLGEYPDKVPTQWLVPPKVFDSEHAMPRFPEVAGPLGVDVDDLSGGCILDDFDNDGFIDVIASAWSLNGQLRYFHNDGDGHFTDRTVQAGLLGMVGGLNIQQTDYNNDGWLDFYLGTGTPDLEMLVPNRMFRNAEGQFFQDVTTATGTGHLQKGHGVGFADLDNDGDQDIYIVMGGAKLGDNYRNALFLNPGNTNHWLKLKLEGTRSNRAAIGARIDVTVATSSGPRHIFKTVNSGGSFGSNPLRQEIGLGNASAVTAVEILWPATGARQRFTALALDHAYRIREGDSKALALDLKHFDFDLKAKHTHQHVEPVRQ